MIFEIVVKEGGNYLSCYPNGGIVGDENDALDLVAACGEHDTQQILLHETNLCEDFFLLRTGTAGAILQKFINYHVRAAILLLCSDQLQGRFREMVIEANRGGHCRVFQDLKGAETWLLSGDQ